eukprot:96425-Pelagomonas_calceolata.AAC.5
MKVSKSLLLRPARRPLGWEPSWCMDQAVSLDRTAPDREQSMTLLGHGAPGPAAEGHELSWKQFRIDREQ